MMRQAITRNALVLALFAIGTAAVLAITNNSTLPQIQCNRELALKNSLLEVIPADRFDNVLLADSVVATDPLLGRGEHMIYRARMGDQPTGMVVQATAPDGYGGAIRLLIGVDQNGTLTGVRMIPPHNETPGLGDNIDIRKSDWITGFNGQSLSNTDDSDWAVRKDGGKFDAFTGATITPRAVIGAVHRTLKYVANEQAAIFSLPADTDHQESCND
ncbi:electron transport complex subunit RsxG [Alcanivorax sp. 1008]|uniref:electron transport complex subunit RsxG n=1 Tax=Alcanivorax sp. 1008 TaxID=2816853 RepID=UPI001DA3117A|nr:electron transport complex subunit RsxG [Alcanivorax sp. 1008]MCC1497240.1 electron transport complex subunit RsxG [Alcanivorax sp. 1008]